MSLNKILSLAIIIATLPYFAHASDSCFIAKENGKIISSEGDCITAYSPQSTFKIALSLIGFDSGILGSEESPTWPLPKEINPNINVCKVDHNPRTWLRDSCVWYSNILTNLSFA